MEWSFDCPGGGVTARQEGERVVCQAIRSMDGGGLYKAWLRGERGRALLGTLIPEGGALRLRRTLSVSQLKGEGAWPPTGAEIALAYSFPGDAVPGPEWRWTDCPCRLLEDRALAWSIRDVQKALIRRDVEGFLLALPYSPHCPFPLTPLFCLSRLERLGGRWYALFRFSRQGRAELLHIPAEAGENRSGT